MFNFLLSIVLLATNFIFSEAILIPFKGEFDDYHYTYIRFPMWIGTPEQKFDVELATNSYPFDKDFYIADKRTQRVGFNPDKSSTFTYICNTTIADYAKRINGTDDFKISDKILRKKPLNILYDGDDSKYAYMGTNRHIYFGDVPSSCPNRNNDCTTFLQSILREFPEQVLTLAFDKIEPNWSLFSFSGHISFGDKIPSLCQSNWAFVPELPPREFLNFQWNFNVDKVSITKYSYIAKYYAVLELNKQDIGLPQKIYDFLLKTLNTNDPKEVACDANVDITLSIGHKDLKIGPKSFIREHVFSKCELRAYPMATDFSLPVTIFSEHCLLMDYKNNQIGYAQRVPT